MSFEFQPGDRVRLTRLGVIFYGGAWPNFVPQAQGGGTPGTVRVAADRPHRPGAAPRPYYVRWDNGSENSYRVEDLERMTEPNLEPAGEPDAPSNIIPFGRPKAP